MQIEPAASSLTVTMLVSSHKASHGPLFFLVLIVYFLTSIRLVVTQTTTPTRTMMTSETTTDSPSTTTSGPVFPTSQLNCQAVTRCQSRILDFYDPKCLSGQECLCVAQNSTGYVDCLKDKCPKNWAEIHQEDLALCEQFGIDMSGNTTYTADSGVPTNLFNITGFGGDGKGDGLSQSDKIALGVGIGFGIPTLIVGLGTWLCKAKKRKGKQSEEQHKLQDMGTTPTTSE